jgi:hypothetical protein
MPKKTNGWTWLGYLALSLAVLGTFWSAGRWVWAREQHEVDAAARMERADKIDEQLTVAVKGINDLLQEQRESERIRRRLEEVCRKNGIAPEDCH